jgi:hypothetical protein
VRAAPQARLLPACCGAQTEKPGSAKATRAHSTTCNAATRAQPARNAQKLQACHSRPLGRQPPAQLVAVKVPVRTQGESTPDPRRPHVSPSRGLRLPARDTQHRASTRLPLLPCCGTLIEQQPGMAPSGQLALGFTHRYCSAVKLASSGESSPSMPLDIQLRAARLAIYYCGGRTADVFSHTHMHMFRRARTRPARPRTTFQASPATGSPKDSMHQQSTTKGLQRHKRTKPLTQCERCDPIDISRRPICRGWQLCSKSSGTGRTGRP